MAEKNVQLNNRKFHTDTDAYGMNIILTNEGCAVQRGYDNAMARGWKQINIKSILKTTIITDEDYLNLATDIYNLKESHKPISKQIKR